MSAPVDVLAVMDALTGLAQRQVPFMPPEGTFDAEHERAYDEAGGFYMEAKAARAAVAELIAAAQRASTALEVFISSDYGTRRNPDPGRADPDVLRLRAALARCGGAE